MDAERARVALGDGMAVTAQIFTGRWPIISFFLSPLQRVVGESGHERYFIEHYSL